MEAKASPFWYAYVFYMISACEHCNILILFDLL